MKLLFESWRQYLVEAEQADLEKDVVALIRKYNLDKQDIKKLLALKEEEDPINEAIGQDLANLYKKYGKQAIAGVMAGMIGLGALAPQSAEAGMLDTGRAVATMVANPSAVSDLVKMNNLIKFHGNEKGALQHLDSVIDTLGGVDEAKKLVDNAFNSDAMVNMAVKSSKTQYKKNLKQGMKHWEGKSEKEQEIRKLLIQYELINDNDDHTESLKKVIALRLGQDSANKVEQFTYKVTGELGWGSSPQEIEVYKNNLAQNIAKIDGRPIDQIGYLR